MKLYRGLIYLALSFLGLFLFIVPGIYIWLAFCLACPILVFENKTAFDSIRKSSSIFKNNFVTITIVLVISTLIGLFGYTLFYVGRMVTYPFVLTTIYALYMVLNDTSEDVVDS